MILAYLRGPAGSRTDYIHSEGCCCRCEPEHQGCKVDVDYTLRNALTVVMLGEGDHVIEWCERCSGLNANCLYCHTAEALNAGQSITQRQKALAALCSGWSGPPPRVYWEAAGIPV